MGGISNEEMVSKAVVAADALAVNGKLNPAQSDKFIDFVVDETVLKDNARIVRFRNEQLEIDKIGLGKRVALPKSEASDPGKRRGVNTTKVVLQPREIMVPFEIGDNFREINIEGDSIEDHIIRMMATQLANDVEDLYINGDVNGPARTPNDLYGEGSTSQYVKDSYMALFDGWSRIADGSHVVDAANGNIGLTLFSKAFRALPTKFRRNKAALRWFLSPDLWQLYQEKFATRATIAGDAAAAGETFGPFGIAPIPVPLWAFQPRQVEHVTLTGTTVVALRNGPVSNVVVLPSTLGDAATTPYVADVDYTLDANAGTIVRIGTGAIGSGNVVKVTYDANPRFMLTHQNNMIVGIGRDIRIEKDRDIFKGVNQYAITAKVSVNFEEVDAISMVKNIGTGI